MAPLYIILVSIADGTIVFSRQLQSEVSMYGQNINTEINDISNNDFELDMFSLRRIQQANYDWKTREQKWG